jgi:hypothetical protein
VAIDSNERVGRLRQDQFAYDAEGAGLELT